MYMKLSYFVFSAILGTALLSAQIISPLPPIPAPNSALKQYLGLTDAQVQQLQDMQKNRVAADQAIYKQINDKQTTINNLVNSGSTDAQQIGQLTIDIATLRKQLPSSGAQFRDPALAILTPDQKSKLPALSAALQLAPTAYQAVSLNLVDAANTVHPVVTTLPAPVAVEPGGDN
jgi:hypothetical protein